MNNASKISLLIFILCFIISGAISQTLLKIDTEKSEIEINGKSTFHNWNAKTLSVNGKANVIFKDKKIMDVTDMNLFLSVESLKSETKGLTKKMHKALESNRYPRIYFKLTKMKFISNDTVNATGLLTLKHVTNEINLTGIIDKIEKQENNKAYVVLVMGSKMLKMTDYDIKPPTFMLGVFKTDDEVDVRFKIYFN